MKTALFALPRPRVFGHRGAAGEAPENTLPSFERAVACGVDVLELDVHATRDGKVVVIHDSTLDRTTDGFGPICEQAWAAVRQLDAGFRFTADGRDYPFRGAGIRIPQLSELFARFPEMRFNIEVKQQAPPIVDEVCRLMAEHGCEDRVLLAAEKDEIMRDIRSRAGDAVATSFSAGEVSEFVRRARDGDFEGYEPPGAALQIPVAFAGVELVTAASVRAAHDLGIEVHVWTINERAEMQRLLALGVDGIMSDLPAIARAAVDEFRAQQRASGS